VMAFNVYGPTETTIWSTMARLDGGAGEAAPGPVSLGEPIGDTTVRVLDEYLEPVPVGVPGEIYLGGTGVARGYRGRPDLTAAQFLADPYATDGARLYRTGDQGRLHPDGQLEYLGRVDRQIKLRGLRIEPAEVERALLAHSSVSRAVVTLGVDAASQPHLLAYVTADGAVDIDLLRAFLMQRLPQYMVPSTIVVVDALPLTANGKVDVRALPAPETARPSLSVAYRPPRTETERAVTRIWTEVLGVDRLGVDDYFFDLGGHSLRAVQVMARVNEAFGVNLALHVLFVEPSVRRLALRVEEEVIAQVLSE
jgi:acyl-coenzyme A synthetase/AMP-(fatty) acid ligase/acyl carrier protein